MGDIQALRRIPFTKKLTPEERRSLDRTGRKLEGNLTPAEEMGEYIANTAAESGTVVRRTKVEGTG